MVGRFAISSVNLASRRHDNTDEVWALSEPYFLGEKGYGIAACSAKTSTSFYPVRDNSNWIVNLPIDAVERDYLECVRDTLAFSGLFIC
jgi:hypothetical protein